MKKEVISDRQAIILIIMFITETSTIIITGLDAKQDLWISVLLAVTMALPIVLIYSRIQYIFPGKGLFDIMEICFGGVIGKGVGILYTWFALHLAAIVLREFGEFSIITSLRNTPMVIPMVICVILSILLVKAGIEVIGRWSEYFLPIILLLVLFTILFLIPEMNINNIRPTLAQGIEPVIKGAFSTFSFPFAEVVIFTMVFSSLKYKKSASKVYIYGLLIAGGIVLITSLVNILVLGVNQASEIFFPSYTTAARISIWEGWENLEALVAFEFLIGGFIKISICLLSASIGISKIIGYKDYRTLVTPIGLILINLAIILYDNLMGLFQWSFRIWPYYAFPFQVIFPVLIWLLAEIKIKRAGRKQYIDRGF